MTKKRYIIRDREAGNIIECFDTYCEAETMLSKFEEMDRTEGIYTEDFYEIVEDEGVYPY